MHGPTLHKGRSCRKGADLCGRHGSSDSNARQNGQQNNQIE